MAKSDKLIPFILEREGGFANVPGDFGGPTCKGVTLSTFRSFFGADKTVEDLKNMTKKQWEYIFLKGFWEKCRCGDIKNESVAYLLCDFAWHSGTKTAVKKLQEIVGVTADGIVGPQTLAAINRSNGEKVFYRFFEARQRYLYSIIGGRPASAKFETGWMRRLFALYRLCYE